VCFAINGAAMLEQPPPGCFVAVGSTADCDREFLRAFHCARQSRDVNEVRLTGMLGNIDLDTASFEVKVQCVVVGSSVCKAGVLLHVLPVDLTEEQLRAAQVANRPGPRPPLLSTGPRATPIGAGGSWPFAAGCAQLRRIGSRVVAQANVDGVIHTDVLDAHRRWAERQPATVLRMTLAAGLRKPVTDQVAQRFSHRTQRGGALERRHPERPESSSAIFGGDASNWKAWWRTMLQCDGPSLLRAAPELAEHELVLVTDPACKSVLL
jgi:hypothetical protein